MRLNIHLSIEMKFRYLLKEYFTYSASEKKGIFVLLILLLLFFLLPYVFQGNVSEFSFQDETRQKELNRLLSEIVSKKETSEPDRIVSKLFHFNPNTVSQSELCSLGFSNFQSRNIIKYRNKGGFFKSKKDLLRIYGISEKTLAQYDSFMEFPKVIKRVKRIVDKPEKTLFLFDPNSISVSDWIRLGVPKKVAKRIRKYIASGASFKSASDLEKIYGLDNRIIKELYPYINIEKEQLVADQIELRSIDLNKVDSVGLKQLSGIGVVLSRRILKYRKLLGGFSSKEQLKEVYGVSKERFDRIADRLIIDSTSVHKLEINSISSYNLRKHPYIDYRTAKDIVRYRDRKGPFSSLIQLRECRLLSDSTFLKMRPYLNIN